MLVLCGDRGDVESGCPVYVGDNATKGLNFATAEFACFRKTKGSV